MYQTSLIEEFHYPKYGPGQLWETAAAQVEQMGGEIRKGCKVTGVRTEGNKVTALEYELDGQTHTVEGDVFFSSMPLKDLVAGMPDVPEEEGRIGGGASLPAQGRNGTMRRLGRRRRTSGTSSPA